MKFTFKVSYSRQLVISDGNKLAAREYEEIICPNSVFKYKERSTMCNFASAAAKVLRYSL